jgi:hypothetical protein
MVCQRFARGSRTVTSKPLYVLPGLSAFERALGNFEHDRETLLNGVGDAPGHLRRWCAGSGHPSRSPAAVLRDCWPHGPWFDLALARLRCVTYAT